MLVLYHQEAVVVFYKVHITVCVCYAGYTPPPSLFNDVLVHSSSHTDHAVLKATKADALLAVEEKMRELCMHRQQHKVS